MREGRYRFTTDNSKSKLKHHHTALTDSCRYAFLGVIRGEAVAPDHACLTMFTHPRPSSDPISCKSDCPSMHLLQFISPVVTFCGS
jgi:hypothetical protein